MGCGGCAACSSVQMLVSTWDFLDVWAGRCWGTYDEHGLEGAFDAVAVEAVLDLGDNEVAGKELA